MFNAQQGSIQRIFIVMGIVLLGYGGWQRYQLEQHKPDPAQIEMQVEVRYAMETADAARAQGFVESGSHETPAMEKLHKKAIRRDILGHIQSKKDESDKLMFVGGAMLFVLVVSPFIGNVVARLLTGKPPPQQ